MTNGATKPGGDRTISVLRDGWVQVDLPEVPWLCRFASPTLSNVRRWSGCDSKRETMRCWPTSWSPQSGFARFPSVRSERQRLPPTDWTSLWPSRRSARSSAPGSSPGRRALRPGRQGLPPGGGGRSLPAERDCGGLVRQPSHGGQVRAPGPRAGAAQLPRAPRRRRRRSPHVTHRRGRSPMPPPRRSTT